MFRIIVPDKFEPSARLVLRDDYSLGARGYIKAVQNPTKQDMQNGIFNPRLTLTNRYNYAIRRREPSLRVEISLPKLYFKNNFDELTQLEFELVSRKLWEALLGMGVRTGTSNLENAPVSAIHYSKNIPLTNGLTPHYLIGKIKEANVKLSLDVNQTDFRNEGYSYKWHSNYYEVAFYDKIKDLESSSKSEKRALEKDNVIQLNLFETFQERKLFEVLRMEVRLNSRTKIKQLLPLLGITTDLTFKCLFNASISQKVLLHYLNEIESRRLPLLDYKQNNPKALLADLIVQNPELKLKRIIQMYGLKVIFDTINPRELRSMFSNQSQRNWYRLMAEARAVKLPITESPFKIIRENLTDFVPLKLIDFQDKMINNVKYS